MNWRINLYDTSTLPTPSMRDAMYRAEVGDDIYKEDPTVNLLEEEAAKLVGKESSLFFPSGTMANLVGLMVNTRRGDEVILEAESHIYYYETGGLASVANLLPRLVLGDHGILMPERVREALRPPNLHYPRTSLLCVENTHNRAGGTVTTPEVMDALRKICDEHGLRLHLDGARIFNAAISLGIPVIELSSQADTVMFCLSKGLSAPVGSMLAGSRATIEEARRVRKTLGGGMRQAGILAAAGLVALREGIHRLVEDHIHAQNLAKMLSEIPDIRIDIKWVQTNIVLLDSSPSKMPADELANQLKKRGTKVSSRPPFIVRMATHRDVSMEQLAEVVSIVAKIMREWRTHSRLVEAL